MKKVSTLPLLFLLAVLVPLVLVPPNTAHASGGNGFIQLRATQCSSSPCNITPISTPMVGDYLIVLWGGFEADCSLCSTVYGTTSLSTNGSPISTYTSFVYQKFGSPGQLPGIEEFGPDSSYEIAIGDTGYFNVTDSTLADNVGTYGIDVTATTPDPLTTMSVALYEVANVYDISSSVGLSAWGGVNTGGSVWPIGSTFCCGTFISPIQLNIAPGNPNNSAWMGLSIFDTPSGSLGGNYTFTQIGDGSTYIAQNTTISTLSPGCGDCFMADITDTGGAGIEYGIGVGLNIGAPGGSVTQPVKAGLDGSGTPASPITLTSCSPSPSTFIGDYSTNDINAASSCTMSLVLPTGYLWDISGTVTDTVTTCPSGTCTLFTDNYTEQFVTQPLICNMQNSATPQTTLTLSGGAISPTTLTCDGMTYNFTVGAYQIIYLTVPSDGANARYRWLGGGTTDDELSCAYPGPCSPITISPYLELGNTYQITANAQTVFDVGLTLTFTGEVAGTPIQDVCDVGPTTATATASCSALGWSDYNQPVTAAQYLTGSGIHIQWQNAAGSSTTVSTPTTGANTYNVDYYKQVTQSFKYTVTGGGSPTAPTLTCVQLGSSGSCGTLTGSLAPFIIDFGSTWSSTNPLVGSSGSERWDSNTATGTASIGASTTIPYYNQWFATFQITSEASAKFPNAISLTLSVTGTQFGSSGATLASISTTYAATASATGWVDVSTTATFAKYLSGAATHTEWENAAGSSSTVSVTSSTTYNTDYYNEISNTLTATPLIPALWDAILSIKVNGTQLGSPAVLATLTTSNGGGSVSSSPYYDNGTQVSFPSLRVVSPAERWSGQAPVTFTQISAGGTNRVDYIDQLGATYKYAISGGGSPTAPTFTYTANGSSYMATLTTSPVKFYLDTASTWSVTNPLVPSSGSERWDTQTTGGTAGTSATTITYYHQFFATFKVSAAAPTTFDSGLTAAITGTQFGGGVTLVTITTTAASSDSGTAWADSGSTATFPAAFTGTPSHVRWENFAGSTSSVTVSSSTTYNANYYKQLQNTYAAHPSRPTAWNAGGSANVVGLYLGVSSSICTITVVGSGGTATCTGYADYNVLISLPGTFTLSGDVWITISPDTVMFTTGGNTFTTNYYYSAYVLQPILVTVANQGVSTGMVALSGCSVSPGSIHMNVQVLVNMTFNCKLTATVPADNTNTRYRFYNITSSVQTGASTYEFSSCTESKVPCVSKYILLYYEVQNTYKVTSSTPSTFAGFGSSNVTLVQGVQAGAPYFGYMDEFYSYCSTPISNGASSASCKLWTDYNSIIQFSNPLIGNQTDAGTPLNVNYWIPTTVSSMAVTSTAAMITQSYDSGLNVGPSQPDQATSPNDQYPTTFFANGLYWEFWSHIMTVGNTSLYFSTSPDGITWTSATTTGPSCQIGHNLGPRFSVTHQGNVVQYSAIEVDTKGCIQTGALNSDGTISWNSKSIFTQGIHTNFSDVNSQFDSTGNVWACYTADNNQTHSTFTLVSTYSPTTFNIGGGAEGSGPCNIVQIGSDSQALIMTQCTHLAPSSACSVTTNGLTIQTWAYNGSVWNGGGLGHSTPSNAFSFVDLTSTPLSGTVYAAAQRGAGCIVFSFASGAWSSGTTVSPSSSDGCYLTGGLTTDLALFTGIAIGSHYEIQYYFSTTSGVTWSGNQTHITYALQGTQGLAYINPSSPISGTTFPITYGIAASSISHTSLGFSLVNIGVTQVSQKFTTTVQSGATTPIIYPTGCNVLPYSNALTNSFPIVVDQSCTLTISGNTFQSETSSWFFRVSNSSENSITGTTCAAGGACSAISSTSWEVLQNTFIANATSPTLWNAAGTVPVTGTIVGISHTVVCSIPTVTSVTLVSCNGNSDYGDPTWNSSVISGVTWLPIGTSSYTITTPNSPEFGTPGYLVDYVGLTLVYITVESNPVNLKNTITVNGTLYFENPQNFAVINGSSLPLIASPTALEGNLTLLSFHDWSQGGGRAQTYVVVGNATLIADYAKGALACGNNGLSIQNLNNLVNNGCEFGAVFLFWFSIFGPWILSFFMFFPALAVYIRTESPAAGTAVYVVLDVIITGAISYTVIPASIATVGPGLLGIVIAGSFFQLYRSNKGGISTSRATLLTISAITAVAIILSVI